jgi:hypothetical protein
MIQIPSDFREFLRLLHANHVEYLLIGGYAVGYHGYPRTTGDMDIWIAISRNNAEQVARTLVQFGFLADQVPPELFAVRDRIVRMGVEPMRLEITTSISGVAFARCYARRLQADIDGIPVSIISLADLKRNKKASGRHKDLEDLAQLP